MGYLVDYEPIIRLTTFVASLTAVAAAELAAPRRQVLDSIRQRWICNLSLVMLNTLLIRLCFKLLPVGLALMLQKERIGLFNNFHFNWPIPLICSLFLLDLSIYLQHVAFHYFHIGWRFHRVHHTDISMDVTTGVRFHPVEIFLSTIYKLIVVLLIGPPAEAVIIFEALLNVTSMFSHGNIAISKAADHWLRFLLVTPDMHRIHHSVIKNETNSNYGFNLSWWDRIFGTYRDQPAAGQLDMLIGLNDYRSSEQLTLRRLLLMPFR